MIFEGDLFKLTDDDVQVGFDGHIASGVQLRMVRDMVIWSMMMMAKRRSGWQRK